MLNAVVWLLHDDDDAWTCLYQCHICLPCFSSSTDIDLFDAAGHCLFALKPRNLPRMHELAFHLSVVWCVSVACCCVGLVEFCLADVIACDYVIDFMAMLLHCVGLLLNLTYHCCCWTYAVVFKPNTLPRKSTWSRFDCVGRGCLTCVLLHCCCSLVVIFDRLMKPPIPCC